MYTVYGDSQSGNCYKIQLLMAFLECEYQWVEVDILAGNTRTEAFRVLNPNQKIPVLVIGESETAGVLALSESNAILSYLAEGTPYLPSDRFLRAKVLQWQFFEQYSHEPYIAVARYIQHYLGLPDERLAEYESKQSGGYRALDVMEVALKASDYLVGDELTIADISLYAYTHVAHEGGFSLSSYPNINRWIAAIQSHAHYLPMGK